MKIALLGDFALFGRFSTLSDNINYQTYFKEIAEHLKSYDYVIANLETPFIKEHKPYKYKSAYISADEKNIDILKYLNISVVNLANNHMFDFGPDGYLYTKRLLEEERIMYFGVEDKTILLKHEENKVMCLGYCCYSTNPLGLHEKGVNPLNFPKLQKKMQENTQCGYNNILSIHAGQEHINYPNYDHILFARKLAEEVPYVYYGHHPHVLQGIEEYNKSLIAYSLGNFCFDDIFKHKTDKEPLVKQSNNNKSSIILGLEYRENGLIDYSVIPIFLGDEKMSFECPEIIENIKEYSTALSLPKEEYLEKRNRLFSDSLNVQGARRNIKYYLTRINFRTCMIVKDLLLNKRRYKKHLKRYL